MDIYTLLVIAHIIGIAWGVGAATLGDVLFFKALKNNKFTSGDFKILELASTMVWVGLAILFLSGFGFFLNFRLQGAAGFFIDDMRVWAKLLIVLIIFINGLVLHWKVFPILKENLDKSLKNKHFFNRIPIVFTSGAISATSWYSVLVLGAWRMDAPFLTIMIVYSLLVIGAVTTANLLARYKLKS